MDIGERLKQIRKYRGLSQDGVAAWFGIKKQSWGAKERGEIGGFSLADIQLFLEKTQIDARWLFGQMEGPIEEADLRLRGPEKTLTQQMIEEIQELRKRTRPLKELDPLAERVVTDTELRRLLEVLIRKRAHFPRILGYLDGLDEGGREAAGDPETKKESTG